MYINSAWKLARRACIALALSLLAAGAFAQQWPSRPIKLIVPVPPGQGADIISRLIAERLGPALGQPVVVENKPGAGTMLGSEQAARSAPDGYTFLAAGSSALAINPHLYAKMAYDPAKDFAPVTQLVSIDFVLCASPALPARTVAEVLKLARDKPGALTYGSPGSGTTAHLAMALFGAQNKLELMHVPYKGSVPAMTDLIGGQIGLMVDSVAVVQSQVKAGKVRAIAVTGLKRSELLPDVPTLDEQGMRGFDVATWTGLVAPAGTPEPILERMNTEVVKILRMPDVQQKIRDLGMSPVGDSREHFTRYIASESTKWGEAVKASGAKVQ